MDKEARKKGGGWTEHTPTDPEARGCLGNGCSWHMPKRRGKGVGGGLLCPPIMREWGGGSLGVQLARSQPSELLPMTAEPVCMSVYLSSCLCKAFISIDPHWTDQSPVLQLTVTHWPLTRTPEPISLLPTSTSLPTSWICTFSLQGLYGNEHMPYVHTHSWPTLSIPVLFILTDVRSKQRTVSAAIKSVGHTNMDCKRSGFAWLLSD